MGKEKHVERKAVWTGNSGTQIEVRRSSESSESQAGRWPVLRETAGVLLAKGPKKKVATSHGL